MLRLSARAGSMTEDVKKSWPCRAGRVRLWWAWVAGSHTGGGKGTRCSSNLQLHVLVAQMCGCLSSLLQVIVTSCLISIFFICQQNLHCLKQNEERTVFVTHFPSLFISFFPSFPFSPFFLFLFPSLIPSSLPFSIPFPLTMYPVWS